MSKKLNEFICPSCGHRWFESGAYGTCDRCQTFFYLSATRPLVTINGMSVAAWNQRPDRGTA